jgi:Fe-S-cluster containining protein
MAIPFRPGFLPPGLPKVIPGEDLGKIMRGLHEDEIPDSCPFCENHRCTIYELRPLICRIHGTVLPHPTDVHNRLTCPRGKAPEQPLLYGQVDSLYCAWLENKRTWQEQ